MNELESLSLALEAETGYDSIPTIRTHYTAYGRDGFLPNTYECVFPNCKLRTRDAEKMWLHVHFGHKHGLSFGKTLNEVRAARVHSPRS